ncbi:hypothetical protein NQ317_005109 [Molorchus minor]|uniref:Uncharacterized protein n=1 Tax=Molorchus minor TaxID=1323400 RepID=A0ABQ9JVX2_9CUCU|nr:hypothetical protein NQ317_005109 [Molorchus minor]
MKQKLAMLESKLRKKDQPENIPKDELTEKANDIYHASAEMQVSTLNNMEQQANICKKLKLTFVVKTKQFIMMSKKIP